MEQLHKRVLPGSDLRQFAEAVEVYRRGRPAPDGVVTPALAALVSFGRELDARSAELSRTLVMVMIPMLAGLIMLLHFRPGRNQPFAKHLVLATHLFAAFLLFMLALEWLAVLLIGGSQLAGQRAIAAKLNHLPEFLPVLVMFAYAYTSIPRRPRQWTPAGAAASRGAGSAADRPLHGLPRPAVPGDLLSLVADTHPSGRP